MNMNNIIVTQTINVKIKDVEHNLTFAEATALYNTLGSVLNLGKTWETPNQQWPKVPYNPYDMWYHGNTPPMNLCSWNNATAEERKERHDSGLFPNHMCTFV